MMPAASFGAATRLLNDDWMASEPTSSNYHELGARPRQRSEPAYTNQPPAMDDYTNQPPAMDDSQSCSYSKVAPPSISSYRQLPEEYLQCVGVETELNLSAGTFYNGSSSGNNVIDISKYLLDTSAGYTPTSKLTVDLDSKPQTSQDVYDANKLHVDLPEICKMPTDNSHKGLRVDLPVGSMPNACTGYQPYNGSTGETGSHLVKAVVEGAHSDSDSYKSRGNSFSSSQEISGGTSEDSGYSGHNLCADTSNLTNSLPKSMAKSNYKDSSGDIDDENKDDSLSSK